MDVEDINYTKQPSCTEYQGIYFRSFLEARWAVLLDGIVHYWEYEPKSAYQHFRGWLPDFAIWVKPTDVEPIYCEVKPISLANLPESIKTKVDECDKHDGAIVGILGMQAVNYGGGKLPYMGWISKRRNGRRDWMPWSLNDPGVVDRRWEKTKETFERMSTLNEGLHGFLNHLDFAAQNNYQESDFASDTRRIAKRWLEENQ